MVQVPNSCHFLIADFFKLIIYLGRFYGRPPKQYFIISLDFQIMNWEVPPSSLSENPNEIMKYCDRLKK